MEMSVYRVDPRMIPPVILAMLFALGLMVLEGPTNRGFLLFAVLLPFFYLGLEILARKITVDERGILVSKFLRSVFIPWSDIDSMDAVQSGRKLFIIIQTEQARPVLITNTISPFSELAGKLIQGVPPATVSASFHELLSSPKAKQTPFIHAWIVCLVMVAMVVGKLMGYA